MVDKQPLQLGQGLLTSDQGGAFGFCCSASGGIGRVFIQPSATFFGDVVDLAPAASSTDDVGDADADEALIQQACERLIQPRTHDPHGFRKPGK